MSEESASVQVESRVVDHQEEPSSATDLIRSMALSSAELWHDVLQRLTELQEAQVVLAQAVAELGTIVRQSLTLGTQGALEPVLAPAALGEGLAGPVPEGPHRTALVLRGNLEPELELDPEVAAAMDAAFDEKDASPKPRRKRRRFWRRNAASSEALERVLAEQTPAEAPTLSGELLPPPPPAHLLEQYAQRLVPQPAPASEPSPALTTLPPFVPPLAQPAVSVTPEPLVVEEPLVLDEPPVVDEVAVLDEPPTHLDEVSAPAEDGPVTEDGTPPAPQALVYTPSNAETSLPFELDAPLDPSVATFQLDPPQVPVTTPVAPAGLEAEPVAAQSGVATAVVDTAIPVPVPTTTAAPEPPVVVPKPAAAEQPEPALVGVLGGRPVAEAQLSASLATEILGSAVAAAGPQTAAPSSESAPLVVSEDLTLVSKTHRKRGHFRLR